MKRPGGKVAILGGGMAGLAAAWRLSEPGWQDRFDSITVYQRGWRLGGKGASSRGRHGRIEEHGLHIWLGSYENAFAMLRECYAELDRPTTDPDAPIHAWQQAMIPADDLGLAEHSGDDWSTWLGTFARDQRLPGDPAGSGREMTAVGFVQHALQLILDFTMSLDELSPAGLLMSSTADTPPRPLSRIASDVTRGAAAALAALLEPGLVEGTPSDILDRTLEVIHQAIDDEQQVDRRRIWLLISLVTAVVRGIVTDNLVTHPDGFRAVNDEDFETWILRHGGHPDVIDYPLIRGVYDLVFGYRDADPEKPSVAAGLMIFLIGIVLFEYKGAIFWKMTAGMGDVIIAPIYEVLHNRGVRFEFFHRLDALHLDRAKQSISRISLGRQARLADGVECYEPLVHVTGLPVFPSRPKQELLANPVGNDVESHFGERDDAESVTLRRGKDFDHVILAVSLGMMPVVAHELVEDSPDWRRMTEHVRTVATQAFQIWLRPDEPALGWHLPGVTVSAYERPFETWASMPQTLWAENWPATDRPGTVAYFCGSLDAPWPFTGDEKDYVTRQTDRVYAGATQYVERHLGLYFPKAVNELGFDWRAVCGTNGRTGVAAMETQHVSVNIDPSDRYVQSVPGSDKYRLRPDESGYDNLVLAGDWTDCGMNAGCIEAAVMSGLQAANTVLGRGRFHRIRGWYLP
ncbi:MAG: FAD-dependent oxidoreductase [Mycolicibacterium cosmeticum]|nr:FAD-dependent oxidoreductase [Mycolicibacterium cosmeticum]